ncbi:MAG: hypothetical protein AAB615_02435 [Patescibacteria group bacterium]
MEKRYKIVVYVPESHSEKVRVALGEAGAGKIGKYTFCTFTSRGVGRFLAGEGANPAIGEVGKLEAVEEERIETVCEESKLQAVIKAMKDVHPYEEVAFDIYLLESF